jgi:endonuclease/exonuclease/phosphatase family metal-dependent hydrolase
MSEDADHVRVVTFNTASGNPRITTAQADFVRLPFYREALGGAPGAPLLALQEVGPDQARALRRAAADGATVLQIRRPGQGNALVIPPRYELLSHRRGYYVLSHLRGIVAGLRRAARTGSRPNWRQYGELRMWIEARLRDTVGGRQFTVLNTHISADGDLKVEQIRAIVRRARAAAALGPVILAGDFNLPADRPRGRDVEAAAVLAAIPDMGLAAPPGRENIDYVRAEGFEPVHTRFWTGTSLRLPGSPNAETVSDHYAEDDVLRYLSAT